MIQCGIFVELKARAGKEEEVAAFLKSARALVEAEPDTVSWYAIRFDQTTFGIFDTFNNEAGLNAHLQGRVAEALFARAPELFEVTPSVRQPTILASKL
jgi:quinol monooxygenase YgiN